MTANTARLGLDKLFGPLLQQRIGVRLALAFGGVFVLMAMMAVFATLHLADLNRRMAHITGDNNQQIARVNQMVDSVSQRAIAVRNLTMLTEPELKQQELDAMKQAEQAHTKAETELLELIERLSGSEAEKALLEAIKRSEKITTQLLAQATEPAWPARLKKP